MRRMTTHALITGASAGHGGEFLVDDAGVGARGTVADIPAERAPRMRQVTLMTLVAPLKRT